MQLTDLMPDFGNLIPYEYERIKCEEYDTMIASLLSGAQKQKNPQFVQVGGIPGSGKSTFCRDHKWDTELFISFDAIMESIPRYNQDIYKLGRIKSFNKWEIPARIIGYEVLRQAVEKKCNIYFEHSGVNLPHVRLVQNIKKYGYRTEMHFILCNPEKAYSRVLKREKITNRHTPLKLIEDRAALVKKYLPEYIKTVDDISIYDTSSDKYVLVHNYRKGILMK